MALRCSNMLATQCVARQVATDRQRTQQVTRGQGTDFPTCDSRTCPQGRALREALDPAVQVDVLGAGPGGRFRRERYGQISARQRLERAGLLGEVPTIDKADDEQPERDE